MQCIEIVPACLHQGVLLGGPCMLNIAPSEQVLAGLGLPGTKPKEQPMSQPDSERPSTVASEGYSSAGDPMHLNSSGKLVSDGPGKTLS